MIIKFFKYCLLLITNLFHKDEASFKEITISNLNKFTFKVSGSCLRVGRVCWKRISDRARSDVYISPCGKYILKLNKQSAADDSYPYYVQTAISYPNNPYFPKIYWHASPLNPSSVTSITFMEALSEAGGILPVWEDKNILNFFNDLDFNDFKEYLLSKAKNNNYTDTWREFTSALGRVYNYTDYRLDLVHTNFMLRGKQVVVIDPIV